MAAPANDRTNAQVEPTRDTEASPKTEVIRPAARAAASPSAQALARLQRSRGNRYVQRLLRAAERADTPDVPAEVEELVASTRGQGSPLPFDARTRMEENLGGQDFGDVRIHTDAGAARAAATIGAAAFTVGNDIYFGVARYAPGTRAGDQLLAHELSHVAQQRGAPAALKAKMSMSSPSDPEEQEAERAAARVASRSGGGKISRAQTPGGPSVHRAVGDEPRPPPEPAPENTTNDAESGDLVIELGDGIRIPKAQIEGRSTKTVELSKRPIRVPGLRLEKLVYQPRSKRGDIHAELAIPLARPPRGGIRLSVDSEGKTEFRGSVKLPFGIGVLKDPKLELGIVDKQVSGSLKIEAGDIQPRGMRKLKVSGGGELRIEKGRLGGSVEAKLAYDGLGQGDFRVGFEDGVPSGKGSIEVTQPALKGVTAGLAIEQGDLKADVTIPATKITPPVPGLSVPEGTIQIVMHNSVLSGTISGLKIVYRDFGEGTLNGTFSKDRIAGAGDFEVKVPALDPVKGAIGFKDGSFYGHATVTSDKFPKGLPVKRGSIKAGIDENADLSFAGSVDIEFAAVGKGRLTGAYEKGKLSLGADATLKVPGLSEVTARIFYVNGDLEGSVDVPVESEKLAGVKGNLHVEYKDKRWKAEQKIAYERDGGKLKGSILLGLAQQEKGDLAIYGGGDVTAQLTSFLSGQLRVDILPEGTTTLKGTIRVTEPIQMFPEKKTDRELFNVSRNIPLWAILVAVIRLRGGVRAGVGPGVFRDIQVTGEYTIGGDDSTPSFTISGEIFIPAFAEAYLAFGVGLGLDVVLGSLTGGIEAVGTAGIYGAVSVIPELAYRDGNYTISGTATMAAGARLKLGLQAWAEIEALWITIWEKTWNLAEWVWSVGPTLALQAKVEHVLGSGEPPSFEFKTSDIGNAEQLINDAMPKEGPKGSGAREALKNRAQWSGNTKGKGKGADKAPEPATKPAAPKAPPKPAKRPKSAGEGDKGPLREKGGKGTPELEKLVAKQAKDKVGPAKMTPDRVPKFPPPTPREIEVGRANYLDETATGRIELAAFRSKMQAGYVYHPKFKAWSTIAEDYIKAYPTLLEPDKDPRTFASKMRGGYYPGSVVTDPLYDATEKSHEGSQDDPYPIHWPTQFLVSSFETFEVAGGTRIPPTPPGEYTVDTGTRSFTYEFGVDSTWISAMGIGQKVKRQEPGRGAGSTAPEWRHWRSVGFAGSGGAAAAAGGKPNTSGPGDANMFRARHLPNATKDPIDTTFGTYIESGTNPLFAGYLSLPRQVDREAFRAAARNGELNVMNVVHVDAWVAYLRRRAEAEQSERGVLGYEMQHVMPLFLWGSSADVPRNMWPLSVSQHRTGHTILRQQPRLKEHWNAPTDNLESPDLTGKWFVIAKHGGP